MTGGTIELAFNPGELSVCIGMPASRDLSVPTALSLARTAHACALRGIPFDMQVVAGSSIITSARSTVAHRFLQGKSSRLFWIDSDMEWDAQDFLRLLALSSKMDVVCAAYPMKRDDRTTYVIRHPEIPVVQKTPKGQSLPLQQGYALNEYGCVKIDGTGLGFTVMTRKVVEAVAATKERVLIEGSGETVARLFRLDVVDGKERGEDIAFFEDIKAAGFDIWLDPRVDLGHVGQKIFRGDVVKALGLSHIYEKRAA